MYTVQCTMYSVQLYSVQSILKNICHTLNVHCRTLYSINCMANICQYRLYSVHCTLYTL